MVYYRNMKFAVTFYSVSCALFLEKTLTSAGIACRVMPVPRNISSSCGYTVLVFDMALETLLNAMQTASIEWETVYRMENTNGKEEFTSVLQSEE